jgi:hypothetical protein
MMICFPVRMTRLAVRGLTRDLISTRSGRPGIPIRDANPTRRLPIVTGSRIGLRRRVADIDRHRDVRTRRQRLHLGAVAAVQMTIWCRFR